MVGSLGCGVVKNFFDVCVCGVVGSSYLVGGVIVVGCVVMVVGLWVLFD